LFNVRERSTAHDVFEWQAMRATVSELQRFKPDLVHIHNVSGATLAPYLACRLMGVPVVNTLHDHWLLCPNNMRFRQDSRFCDPSRDREPCGQCFQRYDYWASFPLRTKVFAALTANVRRFISPSQALVALHVRAGYAPERFLVLTHGLQADWDDGPLPPAAQAIVNSAYQYRTVVFAGGGVAIKGAGVVLEAIPALIRHVEGIRVVIAGAPDAYWLNQLGAYAPMVQVLGTLPFQAMRALFRCSDLTIVPSIWYENSPIVICESHQMGTPVVGSSFGGIPELIQHGKTGYLFPVGNSSALAEQVILHFALSSHERRQMRQNCLAWAARLTPEKHVDGLLRIYSDTLGH